MTSVSPSSFATTWYLCIQKPDGNTLACRFASFGSTIFQDALVLENDGLHAVIADPVDTSGGTVSVRLWSLSNVTGSIAVNGDAVPVSIGTPGQNARLTFTVGAQQSVTVRLTGNQLGSPTIRLLRSDNSLVTALTWSTEMASFDRGLQSYAAIERDRGVCGPLVRRTSRRASATVSLERSGQRYS